MVQQIVIVVEQTQVIKLPILFHFFIIFFILDNFYRERSIVLMGDGYQIPNTMIEHLLIISIFIIFYMALYHLWSNIIPIASNEDYINMLTIEIDEENC